jgi:hypothetical protein
METSQKKPARNAEIYLIKEDKRIYKDLVEVLVALKKSMYTISLPSSLAKALNSRAENAYKVAEQKASKFWGSHEIHAVRNKDREGDAGKIGCFYSDYIHAYLDFNGKP